MEARSRIRVFSKKVMGLLVPNETKSIRMESHYTFNGKHFNPEEGFDLHVENLLQKFIHSLPHPMSQLKHKHESGDHKDTAAD